MGRDVVLSPATVLTPGAVPAPTSLARATARALVVGVVGLVVVLALALLGLKLAGWQTLTVLTGSMRPLIAPGQAIVVSPMPASEIAPGQVITFRRPQSTGTVTHRVQRVAPLPDGRLSVTTKGDANPVGETWQIAATGRVGRHRASLPAIGGAIGGVVAGPGRPYLLGATVLVGTALVLFWIWWPSPRRPDGDPPTDPPSAAAGGVP
jgi:signal peptidase